MSVPRINFFQPLQHELDQFFGAGGTEKQLVSQLNASYDSANWLSDALCQPGLDFFLREIHDYSRCSVPLVRSAVQNNRPDLLDLLVERGADVDICYPLQSTLYSENHGLSMARKLIYAGARVDAGETTALMHAAMSGRHAMMQLLINAGAHVDRMDRSGRTALHLVMINPNRVAGAVESARLLLDAGADPCVFDFKGMTAMHILAVEGEGLSSNVVRDLVRLLVKAGANMEAKDDARLTPLLACIMKTRATQKIVVPVLVEEGADLDATTSDGRSVDRLGGVEVRRWVKSILMGKKIEDAMGAGDPIISSVSRSDPGML